MNWRPITSKELVQIIQESLTDMPVDLQQRFQSKSKKPLTQITCKRKVSENQETLFVIAKSDHHLLVFDDVEDAFGVADLPEVGGAIENWELFPDLGSAFKKFDPGLPQTYP